MPPRAAVSRFLGSLAESKNVWLGWEELNLEMADQRKTLLCYRLIS
jgi:hypothetical protein